MKKVILIIKEICLCLLGIDPFFWGYSTSSRGSEAETYGQGAPRKNVYSGQENKSKNRERRWKWQQLNSRKHGVAKRKRTGEARAQIGRVTNDRELSVGLYSPGDNAHNWDLCQTAPQNWYFPMLLILLQMFPKCWLNYLFSWLKSKSAWSMF